MNKLLKLRKVILVILLIAAFSPNAWSIDRASVEYYPTTGKLTVKAENAELAGALALVSHKTGVWIRIDPSIEKSITIELTNTPLENALRRLARGLNHAMFYESSQGGGYRLVGMSVLSGGGALGAVARYSGRSVTRTYTGDPGSFSSSGYGPGGDGSISQGAVMPGSAAMDVVHMDDEGPRDMAEEQPADVAEDGIAPPAGVDQTAENVGYERSLDLDTEKPADFANEKIVTPVREAPTTTDAGAPSTASPRGVLGSDKTTSDRLYPTPGSGIMLSGG